MKSALFLQVRRHSQDLVAGLSAEDMTAQAFAEASPLKWHLAHATWFFETFLLDEHFDPAFRSLFNSYYDTIGWRPLQAWRGLLTRPDLARVMEWRRVVDLAILQKLAADPPLDVLEILDLGLAHEEQHQELMLTDGLALFACNPLEPAWNPPIPGPCRDENEGWLIHGEGVVEIGHGGAGFAFDNERPRHKALLRPFRLAARTVTCGEWLAFMADGGYSQPRWWQADGWDAARAHGWRAPAYWRDEGEGSWSALTLWGREPVDVQSPVCHVSWYEADAYANWAGARLPEEEEWETAALNGALGGTVWEWTASAHRPYPGWRRPLGSFGEYNGKFMSGRMVCRGGSFATAPGHVRPSYRNFWPPATRWQFTGLRLAQES